MQFRKVGLHLKTKRSLWDSEGEDDMTPPQDPAAITEEEGDYGLNSPP